MTMTFAYDAPTDSADRDVLNWMQSESNATYWALVDVALLGANTFTAAARRHRWLPINALANTPLEAFSEVAPHLIAISENSQERQEQIGQLLQLTTGTPALSWLRSAYPERALQMLFGYLAKAQIQDRPRAVHLRFADARILPGLLNILSANQQRRVVDIVQDWRWFDRGGAWQEWPIESASADAAQMDTESHLHLSVSQFEHLLRNAEADGFFEMLTHQFPELIPAQHRAGLHIRLSCQLLLATEWEICTEEQRWQFVLLGLSHGEDFYRTEAFISAWKVVLEQGATS